MASSEPLFEGSSIQEPAVPSRRYSFCQMASLLAFGFAFGEMMSNFGLIMLPAEGTYMQPENNAFMLGFLLFMSGVSQFSGPVAGYFSDRCQAAMGRRRPYLIVAGLIAVPALIAMKWAHDIYTKDCYFAPNASATCGQRGESSSSYSSDDLSDFSTMQSGAQPPHGATTGQTVMFCAFFLVAMMAFNIQMQMLPSLISDLIPPDQTGEATGVIGVLQLIGSLIGFILYQFISGGFGSYKLPFSVLGDSSVPMQDPIGKMYWYYAPVILICTIITLCAAREKPNPVARKDLPPVTCSAILNCFYLSPTEHRDFFIVTLSRTAYYCGLSTMTFLQYYFRDMVREGNTSCAADMGSSCSTRYGGHLNASLAECSAGHCVHDSAVTCTCPVTNYMAKTALIAVFAQAGACLSAYPSGVASDKIGRKPLIIIACMGMGIIYAIMPFVTNVTAVLAMGFVWGICNGFFQPVDFAIAIDTLPNEEEVARFLGVWAMAAFVGTTIGPVCGGLALLGLGRIEDSYGNGGDESGLSVTEYHYSQYGYIGVMLLGLMWNILACIIIRKVKGCK